MSDLSPSHTPPDHDHEDAAPELEPVVIETAPAIVASNRRSDLPHLLSPVETDRFGNYAAECQGCRWNVSSAPDTETIETAFAAHKSKIAALEEGSE